MSAAATWKTTNAPIHVKNKTSARVRNMNLINRPLMACHNITLQHGHFRDSISRKVPGSTSHLFDPNPRQDHDYLFKLSNASGRQDTHSITRS
jgi:hypothetical protein